MKKRTIELSDFTFLFSGYGHYTVIYRSPKTGKEWAKTTNDMPLIDLTKNADQPKKKDLNQLKRLIKYTKP